MKISVIIPLYNDEKYIGKCLEAVFSSDHKDFEVLVVDDCSTDRSPEEVSKHPCRLIRLEKNAGAGNARNQGASQASGALFVFIDSDVIIEKDTLSRFEKVYVEKGEKICMCNVHPHSLSGGVAATITAIHWNHINAELGDEASFVSTMCFSIDRDVFFEIGRFKPYMAAGGEEFEIGEVIAQAGYKIYVDSSFEIHHHFQDFLPRARTLFNRSFIYAVIVSERRFKLDKGHGTRAEGISSMLSLFGAGSIMFAFAFPVIGITSFIASVILQLLIDSRLHSKVFKNYGFAFFVKSIPIWYCWYFAMGLGVLKGFLVHIGEIVRIVGRVPAMFLNKTPNYIIFFLTNLCNARCKHCFNKNNTGVNDLTLDEIKKISEKFGAIKYLTYSGGEPMLRKDIVEITQTFRENNGLEFLNLITNGFDTDKIFPAIRDILRLCKPMFTRVSFSIDGIGGQHDEIRGVPGGFKRLEATIRKVKALRQYYPYFDVGAIITFSNYNQDNIADIIRYVTEDIGIQASLNFVRGDTLEAEAKKADIDKYVEAAKYLEKMNAAIKGRIRGAVMRAIGHVSLTLVKDTLKVQKPQVECLAGKKMIVIKENGEVMPCEMLSETYGNLRNVDYDVNVLLAKAKLHPGCFCTWECAMQNNIVYSPRHWVRILGRFLALVSGK